MALGDAAAAHGLSVVASTADIRNGANDINRRGDELAAVMDDVADLDTAVHSTGQVYKANITGGQVGSSGGQHGITDSVVIPALPYKRLLTISALAMFSTMGPAPVDLILTKNGDEVRRWRNYARGSAGGTYWDLLPANATAAYQISATSASAWAATDDARFTCCEVFAKTIK